MGNDRSDDCNNERPPALPIPSTFHLPGVPIKRENMTISNTAFEEYQASVQRDQSLDLFRGESQRKAVVTAEHLCLNDNYPDESCSIQQNLNAYNIGSTQSDPQSSEHFLITDLVTNRSSEDPLPIPTQRRASKRIAMRRKTMCVDEAPLPIHTQRRESARIAMRRKTICVDEAPLPKISQRRESTRIAMRRKTICVDEAPLPKISQRRESIRIAMRRKTICVDEAPLPKISQQRESTRIAIRRKTICVDEAPLPIHTQRRESARIAMRRKTICVDEAPLPKISQRRESTRIAMRRKTICVDEAPLPKISQRRESIRIAMRRKTICVDEAPLPKISQQRESTRIAIRRKTICVDEAPLPKISQRQESTRIAMRRKTICVDEAPLPKISQRQESTRIAMRRKTICVDEAPLPKISQRQESTRIAMRRKTICVDEAPLPKTTEPPVAKKITSRRKTIGGRVETKEVESGESADSSVCSCRSLINVIDPLDIQDKVIDRVYMNNTLKQVYDYMKVTDINLYKDPSKPDQETRIRSKRSIRRLMEKAKLFAALSFDEMKKIYEASTLASKVITKPMDRECLPSTSDIINKESIYYGNVPPTPTFISKPLVKILSQYIYKPATTTTTAVSSIDEQESKEKPRLSNTHWLGYTLPATVKEKQQKPISTEVVI